LIRAGLAVGTTSELIVSRAAIDQADSTGTRRRSASKEISATRKGAWW